MIERVVENWLTKAGERTYQVAFCYMLAHRGYSVVHLTRHCAMEMAKDVLAIAPDGVPCAFQLKGGDIKLSDWRGEVGQQVDDLVMGAILHPSIRRDVPHRPYLVTNGTVNEEVHRAIDDRNQRWRSQGYEPLQTITHGEMLKWALDLGSDLWPSELADVRGLIELAMWEGTDTFPKEKLATLLESTIPLLTDKTPSGPACERALASAALVTALSVASFADKENHVAEMEAWVVYASYVIALAERWSLPVVAYEQELNLAKRSAFNALGRLAEELHYRTTNEHRLVEGDATLDTPFYRPRLTWLVGLMSAFAIWRRARPGGLVEEEEPFAFDVDAFAVSFGHRHRREMALWGEAAIPQILAYFWLWRLSDGTWNPDWFLAAHVRYLATLNGPRSEGSLPTPHYEIRDLAPYWIDRELAAFLPSDLRLTRGRIGESFAGSSHYLQGLFHFVVRKNFKQTAKALWSAVSKVAVSEFVPEAPWQLLRWRNREVGHERSILHQPTQTWESMRAKARGAGDKNIPVAFTEDPAFALLHLIVFPHRGNSLRFRWLDAALRERCGR